MGWKAQALDDRQDRIGATGKMGSCMAREKQDDDEKPDLIAHYRPVAIRAVAAALTLKRDKPARPLRETEYSAQPSRMMLTGTMNQASHSSVKPDID